MININNEIAQHNFNKIIYKIWQNNKSPNSRQNCKPNNNNSKSTFLYINPATKHNANSFKNFFKSNLKKNKHKIVN